MKLLLFILAFSVFGEFAYSRDFKQLTFNRGDFMRLCPALDRHNTFYNDCRLDTASLRCLDKDCRFMTYITLGEYNIMSSFRSNPDVYWNYDFKFFAGLSYNVIMSKVTEKIEFYEGSISDSENPSSFASIDEFIEHRLSNRDYRDLGFETYEEARLDMVYQLNNVSDSFLEELLSPKPLDKSTLKRYKHSLRALKIFAKKLRKLKNSNDPNERLSINYKRISFNVKDYIERGRVVDSFLKSIEEKQEGVLTNYEKDGTWGRWEID